MRIAPSEQAGVLHGAFEQSFPVSFNQVPMTGDDPFEIACEHFPKGLLESIRVLDAPFEDPAHPGIAPEPSDMTVEEAVPSPFVGRKVEDQIRENQRAGRQVQDQMLLKLRRAGEADGLNSEHGYVKSYLYELETMPNDDPQWIARVQDLVGRVELAPEPAWTGS